ncbi:potassium-transporting ATPase subunit C [Mycolicibacterium fortuitum]|jgi:K+-transporting ATPase ATPase C chain|uniref:Potassium-transporting ATPase KdpC subunit n=2 Tax=Mycolicibacterium fortuitum TaxID=1766 RepID=A0AAE4VDG3_MYCFO|nr:potassium-transporting ATPase subunit C [Mycolicibacterium fortuitum]MCA4756689.1 potassium-transporting ATPase subunit C [Mycolicibacterium fortuitum]MCV7138162.1 potassium-transporting ATPase subunit C [Mycolicibacterium fortuitum]MDV7190047.1 potassium-transporting ATPase subunit C [Mycolicibacterium fortuitum]MDV7205831.1 potassium-transporting ATPase subunit C [Mycolicibacterium fortuitum]MDV7226113.1 potassium-transporting ATPase subunit C [Mycolicibacterium fortuitum]
MKFSNLLRQHAAALRALLVLTVILGIGYPVFIWLVAQLPGLRDKADGSFIEANGKPVGSSLIGQSFTDSDGNPLPRYFQSRASMAGDGYDPMTTSASNLGPESIVDQPDKPSLLTQVCSRSSGIGKLDGVDGTRPFCTGGGVGAVLSVIGPRDARGNVVHPTKVVSVNEPCDTTTTPFLNTYEGVRVECAKAGEDYSFGLIVPIRGNAPAHPQVPADAVTASGSGLDPHISLAYADLQVNRVAKARGLNPDLVRSMVAQHTDGRTLGFFGEPRVNVLELNIALDGL